MTVDKDVFWKNIALKYIRIAKILIDRIKDLILNKIEKRVFICGSSQTWTLRDYASRLVAKMGYTAITDRFVYRADDSGKVFRGENTPEPDESTNEFIDRMTDNSYSVIIQYNIPGVHYNETERCFNKNKKTLE
jgi:hypothetical protein